MSRPVLCLLPGLDGTGLLYRSLVACLSDFDVRVLDYDSHRAAGYNELVAELATQLPDREFVLIAESFAGPIAVRLAARMPPGLRAVVLGATFIRRPLRCSPLLARLVEWTPAIMPPMWVLERWFAGSRVDAGLRRDLHAALAGVPLAVLRHRALAALRIDCTDELSRIRVPILHLRAIRDRLIDERAADDIHAIAMDARTVHVNAPHFLFQIAPEAASQAIRDFLSEEVTAPQSDCANCPATSATR